MYAKYGEEYIDELAFTGENDGRSGELRLFTQKCSTLLEYGQLDGLAFPIERTKLCNQLCAADRVFREEKLQRDLCAFHSSCGIDAGGKRITNSDRRDGTLVDAGRERMSRVLQDSLR